MNDFYTVLGVMLIIGFLLYKLGLLDNYFNIDSKNEPNNEIEEESQFKLITKGKVFTNTELKFFNELNKVINNIDYYLFTKVRLVDLVKLEKAEYGEYMTIFNKLSKKHIDFIIVDKYGKIEVLIELDDKYHRKTKAIQNDEFKNELSLYLNIPLIRYNAGNNYDFDNLKNILV